MEAYPGMLLLRMPPEGKGKCISRRGRRRLGRRTARSFPSVRGSVSSVRGELDHSIVEYMPGGTHDEARMWVGFVLLLGGVRRLPRTAAHMCVVCMTLSPVGWLSVFLRCIRLKCLHHIGRYMRGCLPRKLSGSRAAGPSRPGLVSRNLRGSTGDHSLGVT